MTSMECLDKYLFEGNFIVYGRDIFEDDAMKNPDHNHVIILYCSSDLWLGDEVDGNGCNCSDLDCFVDSASLQFTFTFFKHF